MSVINVQSAIAIFVRVLFNFTANRFYKNSTSITNDSRQRSLGLVLSNEKKQCSVCGKEITKEEYEDQEGMCWECWDDHLTEESDSMFGDLI